MKYHAKWSPKDLKQTHHWVACSFFFLKSIRNRKNFYQATKSGLYFAIIFWRPDSFLSIEREDYMVELINSKDVGIKTILGGNTLAMLIYPLFLSLDVKNDVTFGRQKGRSFHFLLWKIQGYDENFTHICHSPDCGSLRWTFLINVHAAVGRGE